MQNPTHFLNRWGKNLLAWIGLGGAEAKMRAAAENWLELADKVWAFRRDVLPARDAGDLRARTDELRLRYKAHAEAPKLKQSIEALEPVLKRTGGAIYPKTALTENVEFFLVAAIVIIGVRTYFVQPFKIPTNSMWPSYYGMTPEVYHRPQDVPNKLSQVMRFVLFGARHHEVIAPESGPIKVQVTDDGIVLYATKPAHSWLIFPTTNREYTFFVNDTPVKVQVPQDFDFNWAFLDAFGFTVGQLAERAKHSPHPPGDFAWVTLERPAEQGRALMSFDEITGDQLFVDRISYHFVRPKVGQGFVFFTGNIHSDNMLDLAGNQIEDFYIKRLVGVPGDVIQIHEPMVYRNGAPITGAAAFEKNGHREGKYRGYFFGPANRAHFLLNDSDSILVPSASYFAMGDNSGNSADGRYWGFVPAKEVVGKPLFIYFPFSKRWGPSH